MTFLKPTWQQFHIAKACLDHPCCTHFNPTQKDGIKRSQDKMHDDLGKFCPLIGYEYALQLNIIKANIQNPTPKNNQYGGYLSHSCQWAID
uniref:Uncharacterized protein n=1 Tax=Rhizophora mucronata TaxID=61149 RepID=A0A2P2P714_RHIMU